MNHRRTLLQKFVEYNRQKHLGSSKKKTLLTVSGGVDSVVMCDLFHSARFPFSVAHCNFQLRGKESDADEKYVAALAGKYGAEFFVKKFDTQKYADEKNISIQLAARELRYEWFNELLENSRLKKGKEFSNIATAHHLNDNIETILFNLTKGTGIRGLRGIPVKQGKIIRPLLFASRQEIETYQHEHQLEFREDSSNCDDKYTRNKIRHHVIPLLKEINPSLEETLADKIALFTDLEVLYEREVKKSVAQLFLQRGNDIYIPILKLKKTTNASHILFEYLRQFDFNSAQVEDILASIDAESGKQFLSSTARIIKDRRFFILTELQKVNSSVQFISEEKGEIQIGENQIIFQSNIESLKSEISKSKSVALLDKKKLAFPLLVRPWKAGDYFYPFGMRMKKKKLKKFFTDEKVPLHEKEKVWVVESNKKIVWVAGYRIDERFKLTASTTEIFKMQLK